MGVQSGTVPTKPNRSPQVLIPYPGPSTDSQTQDVFLYLRPEANGVQVESTILRVVEHCPEYRHNLFLVYLANIPGQFIVDNHLIERYYEVQLAFAVHGKSLLTAQMREAFARQFGEDAEKAPIIGAFEALRKLGLRPDELFDVWVDEKDLLAVHGQTIKRYRGYYIVNYDIPALLHKNNRDTDIAVMIFRTTLGWPFFTELAVEMEAALSSRGLLENKRHPRRLFHYSRGPLHQAVDGWCYLCDTDGGLLGVERTSFAAYLAQHGIGRSELQRLIRRPIVLVPTDQNGTGEAQVVETNVFRYTEGDRYPAALAKLRTILAQYIS